MAQPPTPPMPLFYNRVAPLDSGRHARLKLNRAAGYRFAGRTNSVPLGLAEIELAAQHYPVVFTPGPDPFPVALLGYRADENLFIEPDGQWRTGSYIPAYVRAFPFVFIEEPSTNQLFLAIETDTELLTESVGVPLFEGTQPTAALTEALQFCQAYRDNLLATRAYGQALAAAGLLVERTANINFAKGGVARLDGFQVIDPTHLGTVPDATFLDWRKRGWLDLLYAQVNSAGRWGRIVDIAAERGHPGA